MRFSIKWVLIAKAKVQKIIGCPEPLSKMIIMGYILLKIGLFCPLLPPGLRFHRNQNLHKNCPQCHTKPPHELRHHFQNPLLRFQAFLLFHYQYSFVFLACLFLLLLLHLIFQLIHLKSKFLVEKDDYIFAINYCFYRWCVLTWFEGCSWTYTHFCASV